jgi:hypothetical protein
MLASSVSDGGLFQVRSKTADSWVIWAAGTTISVFLGVPADGENAE